MENIKGKYVKYKELVPGCSDCSQYLGLNNRVYFTRYGKVVKMDVRARDHDKGSKSTTIGIQVRDHDGPARMYHSRTSWL